MNSIAVFNHKSGVGKTSLVYHLAWMYADLGYNVLVADLDPQANLTRMFLSDEELERLWDASDATVLASLQSLLVGTGDATMPTLLEPTVGLSLVAGDLRLSNAEEELANQWSACLDGRAQAFRILSAIWRSLRLAASQVRADLVMLDVGPSLGALNRAALLAADHVLVPLTPDFYTVESLRSLGATLHRWRGEWIERHKSNPVAEMPLPQGAMQAIGYVVLPHIVRLDRPEMSYSRWMAGIPAAYRQHVLRKDAALQSEAATEDEHCLAILKHFRILLHLAQEARKPMFALKPADGALEGHTRAITDCYRDFRDLARKIAQRCNIGEPDP